MDVPQFLHFRHFSSSPLASRFAANPDVTYTCTHASMAAGACNREVSILNLKLPNPSPVDWRDER